MLRHLACCILLALGTMGAIAQPQKPVTYDQFQLERDDVYWRKTYSATVPSDELRPLVVGMLKSKFFTFNVVRNEAGYIGEIRHYSVDCKRYGRTYLNTPRMYWEGEWTGKFIVEVMEKQYRVTVYALYFEKMEQTIGYYRSEKPVKGRFVDAVARKDRKNFRKGEYANLDLMNLSLKDNFDITSQPEPPQR